MSIGGLMRTSVSGMNAQATRLAGVSDNIANANTTGYKRQTTEFSSLVLAAGSGQYNSGVVEAQSRQLVSQQGGLTYTSNASTSQAVDLAINGRGFLVVSDGAGGTFLTRAGSFVKNGNGDLVNAAGFILQGYPLPESETQGVLNGFAGLQNVNLNAAQLHLKPTDTGAFRVNLPKEAPVVPTPSAGTAGTSTQAAAFGFQTPYTPASATETLSFTVGLDGRTETISISRTSPATLAGLTLNDIVSAINTELNATVAVNDAGKLSLTSTTKGTASSVSLTGITINGTAPAAGTIQGFDEVLAANATGAAGPLKGTLPGDNAANPGENVVFTATESIVVYDDAGQEVILDIYMTKKVDGRGTTPEGQNIWEYAVFDRAKAGTGALAPFPYAGGEILRQDVTFNASGQLVGTTTLDIQIPNGRLMRLDIDKTSQVGNTYQPLAAEVNGNPPGNVDQITISEGGIVSARFRSGELVPLFKIPMALVESPDNLRAQPGNVFSAGLESGEVLVGFGGESGLGVLVHGALEQSTVDLASELTTMIESQRSYTANSKVFQTGSEILDVLVNLKR